jgi:ABC-type Fe3+-hydroxamate transport system substrate-binding protein
MSVLILLTLTISLSACSRTPRELEYTPQPIDRPELILPVSEELRLSKIDWIIITPDNATEEFDKIKASGKPVVVYALTNSGYEALALDMAKILKKLSEQNAIIVAYEDYYSNGNENDITDSIQ